MTITVTTREIGEHMTLMFRAKTDVEKLAEEYDLTYSLAEQILDRVSDLLCESTSTGRIADAVEVMLSGSGRTLDYLTVAEHAIRLIN